MSYTQTTTASTYSQENSNASIPASASQQQQQQQRQQQQRQQQQQQQRRQAAIAAQRMAANAGAAADPRATDPSAGSGSGSGSVSGDIMDGFSAGAYSWPILFAVLPPLGALLWGSAEAWGDFLLLALISYYLYNFIKVPWELYHAAVSRRQHYNNSAGVVSDKPIDAKQEQRRQQAAADLRRQELSSLLLVVASPFIAGYSLLWTKSYLSDYDKYISNFNIVLFVFAASIRPFVHVVELAKQRALYLQEQVHYPSTEVEVLKKRVVTLEQEINMLKKAFATKKDLGQVTSNFAPTLSQFNRSLKRFEKKEHLLRTYSEERFDFLMAKMHDFDQYVQYRIEQEQRVSPQRFIATLLFFPLNLTLRAVGVIAGLVPIPRALLPAPKNPKPIGLTPNGLTNGNGYHSPSAKEVIDMERQFHLHRQAMEAGGEGDGSESEESVGH